MKLGSESATAVATVSIGAIAEALGLTMRSAQRLAKRASWPWIAARSRGGVTRRYLLERLPETVRAALAAQPGGNGAEAPQVRPDAPAGGVAPYTAGMRGRASAREDDRPLAERPRPVGDLAAWQLEVGSARAALLDEIERAAAGLSVAQAEERFCAQARSGSLGEDLLAIARAANARRGNGERRISVARLREWRRLARGPSTPAQRVARLAPRGRGRKLELDADVRAALAKYRQPNKPSLAWCVREVLKDTGGSYDSLYNRCARQIRALPAPLFHVGRNTGAALRALQPFRRRAFEQLLPNDVWVGDGHGAKLRVAHPETGAPFVPEVTVILDVQSRYAVGWSVSLSENCLAVADALRHGISRCGLPLVYYSDNGGGQKNKMFDAPITGVLGALGIHHETGRPSNPQGRGVIERFWQTVLMPLARRFATYRGDGADRETLRKVTIEIDRELRAAERSEVAAMPRRLPPFHEFIAALDEQIGAYNEAHRHRSLPKLDGARHATPAEYRASRIEQASIERLEAPELAALFMPSVLRRAARGEVRLWGGIYYAGELVLADGEQVRVCYDVHDASAVWVKRMSGELICRAELGANRSDYMPKPLIERLRDQRAARRMKLLQSKAAAVAAEHAARTALAPERTPEQRAELEALEAELTAPRVVNVHELGSDAEKHAHWRALEERRAAGAALAEQEEQFWAAWRSSEYFRLEREMTEEFEQRLASGA